MVIGWKVYFRSGPAEIVYQTSEEVVVQRIKDNRLVIWSKEALLKWIKAKREKEQDEKKKNHLRELAEKLAKRKESVDEKESKGKEKKTGKAKKAEKAVKKDRKKS